MRIYFVGIGGVGMSGLAQAVVERGEDACGSDLHSSPITQRLQALGVRVYLGHSSDHIEREQPDLVVASAAIKPDNPEIIAARERGITVMTRAEFLGQLMKRYSGPRVAVAGTHGKTTTTAMAALVMMKGGLDPTVLVGGDVGFLGGNARIGTGEAFITEACEAYDSFLHIPGQLRVITNIEPDHLDYFGNFDRVLQSFRQFARGGREPEPGCVIACADDRAALELTTSLDPEERLILYGLNVDVRHLPSVHCAYGLVAREVAPRGNGFRFEAVRVRDGSEERLGRLELQVPGLHNVRNALAALAVGLEAGVSAQVAAEALGSFRGVERRFEVLGEVGDVLVLDDYAHHPTEIAATLAAARQVYPSRRLVAVFQPHLYSRTVDFLDGFAEALAGFDAVLVTDIYPAREAPIPGVSGRLIVERIAKRAPERTVLYVPESRASVDTLREITRPGDVVLTIGAGDVRQVGTGLLER